MATLKSKHTYKGFDRKGVPEQLSTAASPTWDVAERFRAGEPYTISYTLKLDWIVGPFAELHKGT